MATRVSKTISMMPGLMHKVAQDAEGKGISFSKQIENCVREYYTTIQRIKEKEGELVACDNCNSKYSSKLDNCPNCEDPEIEAEEILAA